MSRKAWNAIEWTDEMISFLKENWQTKTNKELAKALGLKLTSTRTKLLEMGLKRMEMEYWTEEQVDFLKANYKTIGDTELAEIFSEKWHKEKGWTKKHIEKKRRYLGLKRTKAEREAIHARNVEKGRFAECPIKAWETRGTIAPEGTIRYWKYARYSGEGYPFIKTKNGFQHWNRWAWEKHYGPIPKGMNVIFKDGNSKNLTIDNLELIDNAELAKRNAKKTVTALSDSYVAGVICQGKPQFKKKILEQPALLELKRQQLKLNREIRNYDRG